MGRSERLEGIGSWQKEADEYKETFDRYDRALLGLYAWVHKETSCAPRLILIQRIPTRKGSHKLRALMRIFTTRNGCQLYVTIKTPKSSLIKVCIIYPSSGTLELWKFSNLTFGGCLVGTTPILFTRSSLFLFHMCCLEHVRTVRFIDDFWHHQLLCVELNKFGCIFGTSLQ